MASLNTSANGPSISASYQKIVNAPAPTGAAASSSTYGQWAVFSVQAPLVNAFQQDGSKESVLKVQTTGEGELLDMIDEFSDGRIQFAFVKITDPNTRLPKSVLVAWCGEGVPERTKGYFTSHLNAVSKILHGYHVQVTARSDRDLTPESIVQKVQDSSGSKYGGGSSNPTDAPASGPPRPAASKPVMPTKSFGTNAAFQPLGTRTRQAPASTGPTDEDGWGADAPQVTRSQLEKVGSAYQPTKVDMGALQSQKEPSRYQPPQQSGNDDADVVRGGYQPIGKVDIAAIRKQAQEQSKVTDDRPTVVKGAYEPIGKVDIAEIRRKAQGASSPAPSPAPPAQEAEEAPKPVADRMAAFSADSTGGRLTSLPKPQVANRFGSSGSNFAGTKAPAPGGFEAKTIAAAAPIGVASRSFADQSGKTPAQLWEEKKRARGASGSMPVQHSGGTPASPITSQQSGGWQSTYGGKKWDVQIPSRTGGSGVNEQKTGDQEEPVEEEPEAATGNVGSIRDRFKDAAPMGAVREQTDRAPSPPALDTFSKPNAGARGVPIPGLPQRPQADVPSEQHQDLPPPPPRPQPADEEEEEQEEEDYAPQGSPPRIAMPVSRSAAPEPMEKAEQLPPPSLPTASLATAAADNREANLEPEPQEPDELPARSAAQTAAASTFGNNAPPPAPAAAAGGKSAVAQYDYEKAEDNELELREGERVSNIDMVDEDWWMGQNERGETGLFPSNYVELVEDGAHAPSAPAAAVPPPAPVPAPAAPAAQEASKTATAQYDYEAAEDNELSFPDGATITGVVSPAIQTTPDI